ncbi:unnamed protein product [Ectocarpus sp. 12 AP-2014]
MFYQRLLENVYYLGMVYKEIAAVDQYTYLGVEIAKNCSWNAHVKGSEKGQSTSREAGRDTRKEYAGEVWEGNEKVIKELEAAQMKAAKIILGCSKRTSNAAVSAEFGMESLRSGRDARKLTWRYRMCGMGEKRLPIILWEAKWANKKRRNGSRL